MNVSNLTQELFDALEEGIFAVRADERISCANSTACALFEQQLTGLSLADLPEELADSCRDLIEQALEKQSKTSRTLSLHGKMVAMCATPLSEETLITIQDKRANYQSLAQEKEFIQHASHELRTPFTVVRGFAETLRDLPKLSATMRQEIAGKMVLTCTRLDKIVTGLLTLADIEHSPQERFRPFDLIALAEQCADLLRSIHPEVTLRMAHGNYPISVKADRDLVDLAIMNLLENAVRYSNAPITINVSIEIKEGKALVQVRDQGIGICEEDLPRIFQRFYAVDKARSRKSGGAGLGLSIVKSIAEIHAGSVGVVSEPGKGSQFTLALPT